MPFFERPNPTARPVEATAGSTSAFAHRSPSTNLGQTPSPGAQKQVVLAGNTKISRRSFSPLNRMSKSILASISPIAKCSPMVQKTSVVNNSRLRGRLAAAKSNAVTPSKKSKPSNFVMDIQNPDGRILVHEVMSVAMPLPNAAPDVSSVSENAHLDDNISVVTILDAIGFGQYADLFEKKQIPVEQLLSMNNRDLEKIPEIGQANAALLSRALQRL